MSAAPPGTSRRANVSPARNVPYRTPAEPRPTTISRGPMRIRRAGGDVARAKDPSPIPVQVMRVQKRARGPRNVAVNAAVAASRPTAGRNRPGPSSRRGRTRRRDPSATDHAGEQDPGDEQRAEGKVQAGGLQVDHRDRARLSGGSQLGGANDLRQERQ